MNSKQRNKNISSNILSIVSNRLKPVNESVHLCRTSCHTCLYKTKSQLNAQEKPLSKIIGNKNAHNKTPAKFEKQKNESRLRLCSNLYSTIIYQSSWQKFKQQKLEMKQAKQEGKPSLQYSNQASPNKKIMKQDTQSQTQQKDITLRHSEFIQTQQQMYNEQSVQQCIKEWMAYVIGVFSNLIFPTERDIMSLPFSDDKQLRNMRMQINCLADQHNSLYKDYFQCPTQNNKSQFKKSMNTAASTSYSLGQTRELKWFDINQSNFSTSKHSKPSKPKEDKKSSVKLLESSTTIPSQMSINRNQLSNNEQFYRMLLIQSSTIQLFLQKP